MSQLTIFDFVENEQQADSEILDKIQSAFPDWEAIGYTKTFDWGWSDDYAADIRKEKILGRIGSKNTSNRNDIGYGDRSKIGTECLRLRDKINRGDHSDVDYKDFCLSFGSASFRKQTTPNRQHGEDI